MTTGPTILAAPQFLAAHFFPRQFGTSPNWHISASKSVRHRSQPLQDTLYRPHIEHNTDPTEEEEIR